MEIKRLHNMLTKAGIEHEWINRATERIKHSDEEVALSMYGEPKEYVFWQIIVHKPNGERLISAIEGFGTYGYGLYGEAGDHIEIQGLLTPEEEKHDSVVGWLTAEEVFRRIKEAIKWST